MASEIITEALEAAEEVAASPGHPEGGVLELICNTYGRPRIWPQEMRRRLAGPGALLGENETGAGTGGYICGYRPFETSPSSSRNV
jgi:hypothetical protein